MPKKTKLITASATSTDMPALTAETILGKPYNFEWAVDGAKQALAMHNQSGVALGLYLIAIKEKEEHGRYLQALAQIGIPERTASRYARRAAFIVTHGKFKSAILADLTGAKLDALRHLPDTTIEEIMGEDGKIAGMGLDEVRQLTTEQFADVLTHFHDALRLAEGEIHDLEKALAKQEGVAERFSMEKQLLEDELKQRRRPGRYPAWVEDIRLDSTHLTDKAAQCINELELIFARFEVPELDPSAAASKSHFGIAVTTYYHNLRALVAKSARLLAFCREQFGEDIDDSVEGLPMFSEAEAASVIKLRNLMLNEMMGEKAFRKEMPVKKKRGRPSTKK